MELPNRSERDWPEDFSHENGKYQNKCLTCQEFFYGYKCRVICKACDDKMRNAIPDRQDEIQELKNQLEQSLLLYQNQCNTIIKLQDENIKLKDMLSESVNGIKWYMDMHPESASTVDDEFIDRANELLK